jgi:hypothetical protein
MALRIPEQHIRPLLKICSLSEESADQLIGALSSAKVETDPSEMIVRVSESVPNIPLEDLSDIIRTVYALYPVRELSEVADEQFLDDLIIGIQRSERNNVHVPVIGDGIRDRLRKLLDITSLRILSKAINLQRDGDNLYCEAKILSDVRPVFSEDVGQPMCAVVTHTLKLGYHKGGRHKEIFLVLDRADLGTLQEVLRRAAEKDRELRIFLGKSNIPALGV